MRTCFPPCSSIKANSQPKINRFDLATIAYCSIQKIKSKMRQKFLVGSAVLLALVLCNNASQAQQKNENGKSEIRNNITINAVRSGGSDEMQIDYNEDGHRYKIR